MAVNPTVAISHDSLSRYGAVAIVELNDTEGAKVASHLGNSGKVAAQVTVGDTTLPIDLMVQRSGGITWLAGSSANTGYLDAKAQTALTVGGMPLNHWIDSLVGGTKATR